MTRDWFGSLQLRLALRVAALYIAATVVVIVVLMSRAYDTARSLSDGELMLRATALAKYVSVGPNGVPRLDLRVSAAYDVPSVTDIFAIRDAGGRVIAASPPQFGDLVAAWPRATDEPVRFSVRLENEPDRYNGLNIKLDSGAGPLSISVARSNESATGAYLLLRKFIHDVLWAVSFLVLASLAFGILAIRSGLKSVRGVSEMASAIGPHATAVRLPDKGLPSEIRPLVIAVNRALDRLEQGFAVQRKFTANAAHELRTPLGIITVALDAMEGNGELIKVKADVERMNRLVDQLLRVAQLDAIALDVSGTTDLNDIARGVVATMAPWALTLERTIAFGGPDVPVNIKGNGHAIADAIRNLVENAVLHSPARTEVMVSTHTDGTLSVIDQGPGILAADRQRIFDRFWRGKGVKTPGAGLGLSIVQEIMKMHDGRVAIEDGPEGGSVFTLHFTLAARPPLSGT